MTKTHLKWFGHVRRRATIEAPQTNKVDGIKGKMIFRLKWIKEDKRKLWTTEDLTLNYLIKNEALSSPKKKAWLLRTG